MKVHTKGGNIMATTTKAKAKKDSSAHRYFMKVTNDDEGWRKIEAAKSGLNKDRYSFTYKYNGKSIPGVYRRGYYSCVKKYATHVRVYLNVKDDIRRFETIASKRAEMERELRSEELRHEREMMDIHDRYTWWLR